MTRNEFLSWKGNRCILLDGATGTNLALRGMPKGTCTELWLMDHPDVIVTLQKEYVEAGSELIYAPTFQANPLAMKKHGLSAKETQKLNIDLVALSRKAAGDKALVAGDLTTVSSPISEDGPITFMEAYDSYCFQIEALQKAGVDVLIGETLMGQEEAMAICEAAKSSSELPLMLSFSCTADGSFYFGGNLWEAAELLSPWQPVAYGINCASGPDQLPALCRSLKEKTSYELLMKPNAGMPKISETGTAVYPLKAQDFAMQMSELISQGLGYVGGCCGTTPEFIRQLRHIL